MRVTIVLPRVDLPAGRSRFVAGSLAAHVALALGIVWVPTWWRGPILPSDAMTVELVGALPEPAPPAPPAPSDSTAAEPEPEPEPPKEEVQLATPPPVKPKATPTPKPKATPKPASPRPTPTTPPQATPAATGGEGAAGSADRPPTAGSAAAGGSVSALAGLDSSAFGWYRAAVTQALYGRWQRPIVEGLTGPVEVKVAFEIQRNGQVSGLRLEQASGVPTLDRSALRAVSDASPLPPLPPGLDGPLPASFVFRLYPEGG